MFSPSFFLLNFLNINPSSILDQVIAGIIVLIIGYFLGTRLEKFRERNENESKEEIRKIRTELLRLSGQESQTKEIEIPKTIKEEELKTIIKIKTSELGDFIKIDEDALRAILKRQRMDEVHSLELFHSLKILSKTINQFKFLTNNFKKCIIGSIAWSYANEWDGDKNKLNIFEKALGLTEDEKIIFKELISLNRDDRVVFLIISKLNDIRQMKLTDEEKLKRFNAFYDGIRKTAYSQKMDLGISSFIFVGLKKEELTKTVDDCLEVIRLNLQKSPFHETILEARGYYCNLAAAIALRALAIFPTLAIGPIYFTRHRYEKGTEIELQQSKPKIWITLLRLDKVSDVEQQFYINKENEFRLLEDKLEKSGKIVSPDNTYYTQEEINLISQGIREDGMVLFKTSKISIENGWLHEVLQLINGTIEHYRDERKRILVPISTLTNHESYQFSVILHQIGFYRSEKFGNTIN